VETNSFFSWKWLTRVNPSQKSSQGHSCLPAGVFSGKKTACFSLISNNSASNTEKHEGIAFVSHVHPGYRTAIASPEDITPSITHFPIRLSLWLVVM
jgi:hypothetical protein